MIPVQTVDMLNDGEKYITDYPMGQEVHVVVLGKLRIGSKGVVVNCLFLEGHLAGQNVPVRFYSSRFYKLVNGEDKPYVPSETEGPP